MARSAAEVQGCSARQTLLNPDLCLTREIRLPAFYFARCRVGWTGMPITKMAAAADGAKAPARHKGGGACLSGLCLTFVFALFAVAVPSLPAQRLSLIPPTREDKVKKTMLGLSLLLGCSTGWLLYYWARVPKVSFKHRYCSFFGHA